MATIEVSPTDYQIPTPDGMVLDLPENLPIDEAICALCDNPIGLVYDEWVDHCGNERRGPYWIATFRTDDGRYVCEECA